MKEIDPDFKDDEDSNLTIIRLGKKKASTEEEPVRSRPTKVVFNNTETKKYVLKNARKLKNSKIFTKIGITTDKTRKEVNDEEQLLRLNFRERKENGEDVILDYTEKKVILRKDRPVQQKPTYASAVQKKAA